MAKTYDQIIFDNNELIREQTEPNSITPDIVANQLDAVATYATNAIALIAIPGTTITDLRMEGRNIALIVINDFTKNSNFTKAIDSDTINFSDGTSFLGGENITIIML